LYVSSEDEEDDESTKRKQGMFLRLAPEFSHVRTPRRFKVETRSPGIAIDARESGRYEGVATGGRVEIGYGNASAEGGARGAIVPRMGLSLSVLREETYSNTVLGIDHEFTAQPFWFSVSPGVEIQFPYRFL